MTSRMVRRRLERIFAAAPRRRLRPGERLLVISDLHLGDGGRLDDFRHNGELLQRALAEYYLPRRFTLVLNGDIEELQRFPASRVRERWRTLLEIFAAFQAGPGLIRLRGNHDMAPGRFFFGGEPAGEALRLDVDSGEIFLFHGHQASRYGPAFNRLLGWVLRRIASPLGIRNYTVAYNSRRKYAYEKRVYRFARSRSLMAVMGHTHRPLFESMSRLDRLKMRIESACRRFSRQAEPGVEAEIRHMKEEYRTLARSRHKYAGGSMLYQRGLLVPCLFNSGCGIGRGGITAVELDAETADLVLWFHLSRNDRYVQVEDRRAVPLAGGDIHRVALKTEELAYILTRIRLLA